MFDFLKKNKNIVIKSPLAGKLIELEDVPDKVFSQKMVGVGAAVKPENDLVKAPVKGEVIRIASSHHALGIKTKIGLEILIHLGIDSVKLKGRGFEILVEEGVEIDNGYNR